MNSISMLWEARSSSGYRDLAHKCLWSAGLLVLANLPFWILGLWFSIDRPVFNLDILIALMLARRGRSVVVAAVLFASWIADAIISQSLTFHFASPWEFMRAAEFARLLDVSAFLSVRTWACVVVLLLAFWIIMRLLRRARTSIPVIALVLVAVTSMDYANNSSFLSRSSQRHIEANISGSSCFTLLRQWWLNDGTSPVLHPLRHELTITGFEDVFAWFKRYPGRSALLVLVESMGEPEDSALGDWTDDQLTSQSLLERYTLKKAYLPFDGGTTAAELRALCGLAGSYRALHSSLGCLPAKLHGLGLTSYAFHGFSGSMFDRREWWPLTGLDHLFFREQLPELPQCSGPFRGVCDTNLLELAAKYAERPNTFAYVVTLNTHLPIDKKAIPPDLEALCAARHVDREVCQLSAGYAIVLQAIRRIALSAPESALPLLIVMGDHAPPFVSKRARESFDPSHVPAYVLEPRDAVL
jgi:hypothetical protein